MMNKLLSKIGLIAILGGVSLGLLSTTASANTWAADRQLDLSSLSVMNQFQYNLLGYNYESRTFTVELSAIIAAGSNPCHSRYVLPLFKGETQGSSIHVYASVEERQVEIDPPCDYTYDPQYKRVQMRVQMNLNSQNNLSIYNVDGNGNVVNINSCQLSEMFCSSARNRFARNRCMRRITSCQ